MPFSAKRPAYSDNPSEASHSGDRNQTDFPRGYPASGRSIKT
jgi:hypothetical protein